MVSKIHKVPVSGIPGFTLIEMVVSVSIALVLTGAIIVNYNSYNDVQTLKQAALTLKNDFRFIQSKALAGEKPITPTPAGVPGPTCTPLIGWVITFTAASYALAPSCGDGSVWTATTVTLPSGVTFSPVPSPITYLVLQGTTLSSVTTITLSGASKQYRLQVSPGGDIGDLGIQ